MKLKAHGDTLLIAHIVLLDRCSMYISLVNITAMYAMCTIRSLRIEIETIFVVETISYKD
jgi:hypothetical protein